MASPLSLLTSSHPSLAAWDSRDEERDGRRAGGRGRRKKEKGGKDKGRNGGMEVDMRQKYYRETVVQIFVFHFMWKLEFEALFRL